MTISISLDPINEQRLRDAALARGVGIDEFAANAVVKALEDTVTSVQPRKKLVFGLKAGRVKWIAEDFDSPLPDSLWLGQE